MALIAALLGLFGGSFLAPPHPVSWLLHFAFVLILTILILRNLLGRHHVRVYFMGLLLLMASWEAFEWFYFPQVFPELYEDLALTVFDTAMDSIAGMLGAVVGAHSNKARSRG